MNDFLHQWFQAAEDDLAAIEAMLPNEQLTNVVSFHAQQVIEKCFKGMRELLGLGTPKTHDLIRLYNGLEGIITEQEDDLDSLNELYIEARYPGDMGLLPHGKPTKAEAENFYQIAKRILEAAKQQSQPTPNSTNQTTNNQLTNDET